MDRVIGIKTMLYAVDVLTSSVPEWHRSFESYAALHWGEFTYHDVPTYSERYYGSGLQIPFLVAEVLAGGAGMALGPGAWEARHAVLFLYFWVGLVFLYWAVRRLFGFRGWALASIAMVLLSPRLFADSFYNIKDMGFFSVSCVAFWALVMAWHQPSIPRLFVVVVTSALASWVRIIGMEFFLLAEGWLLVRGVFFHDQRSLVAALSLPLLFAMLVYAMYPVTWRDPFMEWRNLFSYMGAHPWSRYSLLMGTWWYAHAMPWFYIPSWILVTVPLPILLLSVAGIVFVIRKLRPVWPEDPTDRVLLSCVLLFVLPLAAVILGNSTVYNGWRQMYFLYLPLVVFATFGLKVVWEFFGKTGRAVLVGILSASAGLVCLWMVLVHPYQNVYFNVAAGPKIDGVFQVDYWALSAADGLQSVASVDARSVISVAGNIKWSLIFQKLRPDLQVRFREGPNADYYFSKGDRLDAGLLGYTLVRSVTVPDSDFLSQATVLTTYRRNDLAKH